MSSVNFLEKLLGGVEVKWTPMGDVMQMRAGQHISAENIASEATNNFPYPCFGGNGIRGFVSKSSHEGNYLIIGRQGALCGNVQRASGKFYATEHAVVVTPSNLINVDWAFHLLTMMNLNQYASKSAQPGLAVGKIASLQIPIPCPDNPKKSLEIQAEIVRILDAMTAHTAELTAELTARKKQYNYYRDKLLSFEDGEVGWKTLGEVARIKNGKDHKLLADGSIPVYGSGGIMRYVNQHSYDQPSVLIPRKGSLGNLFYVDKPFWNVDTIFYTEVNNSIIRAKFFYHFLTTAKLGEMNQAGGVPSQTQSVLNKLLIPIPSLTKQDQIIAILDKFDALTNSITEGLPREIELRQKQYAYYRDLLLSFPKPPTI